MIYKFSDKKSTSGGGVKNKNMSYQKLAKELKQPIIRKLKKEKEQPSFMDNIQGTELADIQSINKFDKVICFFITCF